MKRPRLPAGTSWLDVLWWTVQGLAVAILVALWIVGLLELGCAEDLGREAAYYDGRIGC